MVHPDRKDFARSYFAEGARFIETLFPGQAEQQQDVDALCEWLTQSLTSNQYRTCMDCYNSAISNTPPTPVEWSHFVRNQNRFVTLIVPPSVKTPLGEILRNSQSVRTLEAGTRGEACTHQEPTIIEKTACELTGPGFGVLHFNFAQAWEKNGKKIRLEDGLVSVPSNLTVHFQKLDGSYFAGEVIGALFRSSGKRSGSSYNSGHYVSLVILPDRTSKLFGNGGRVRFFSVCETAGIFGQGFLPIKCETSSKATHDWTKGAKFLVRILFTKHGIIPVDQKISTILEEPIPEAEPEPEPIPESGLQSFPVVEVPPNTLPADSPRCRRRGHSDKRLCPEGCLILTLNCCVCLADSTRGHFCSNFHFVCSSCFQKHVINENNAGTKNQIRCVLFPQNLAGCSFKVGWEEATCQRVIFADGRLGCPETYKMFAPPPVESSESEAEEGEDDEKLFANFLRILRNECPRCGQIWSTPENGDCAAVTCGKKTCGINFCGYCNGSQHNHRTEVTREDAHRHVKECPFNPKPGLYHPPVTVEQKTDFSLLEAINFLSKLTELCDWLKKLPCDKAIGLVERWRTTPTASRENAHYCLDRTLNMLKEIQLLESFDSSETWTIALLRCRQEFFEQVQSQQAAVYAQSNLNRVIDQHVIEFYVSFSGTSSSSSTCSKSSPPWSSSTSSRGLLD